MFIYKVLYKIKSKIARKRRKKTKRGSIPNDISIISCNCIGGMIYHDYVLEFKSPTINMYIETPDFVKFCLNLKYFINTELTQCDCNEKYPIGLLGGGTIKLHFLHYKSFEEAKNAWERRKTRINYDKIVVIISDRDNFSEDLLPDIDKIPYPKVLFSHKNYSVSYNVYVEKDKNKDQVDDLTRFYNFRGERIYEHYFDFEKWLNGVVSNLCKKIN